jgi:hypothetical protein
MRNLFDQYRHPENQLTHALFSALDADRQLLRKFLRWVRKKPQPKGQLIIIEQSLPGDPLIAQREEENDVDDRRGLPDACVHTAEWALVVESKLAAALTLGQLRRHDHTVRERGFHSIELLALTIEPYERRLPSRCINLTWAQVYEWLHRNSKSSSWAQRVAQYMEVAEARDIKEQYMTRGTITRFAGLPFSKDNPYNYREAKRNLELLRRELVGRRDLQQRLGADQNSAGRGAITGREASAVWDYIGLRRARGASTFTQYPHLTLGVHSHFLDAYVTVPNGVKSRFRTEMLGDTLEKFEYLVGAVTRQLVRSLKPFKGAVPRVTVMQRHYLTQRSPAIIDCLLQFDPRTAIQVKNSARDGVKLQPQWLAASRETLKSRRSNLQLQIGAVFPYATCQKTHTSDIVEAVALTWLAARPLLDKCR